MENTSWLKQAKDSPLFPDVLWSRPENRRHAGKLLIIGGNSHAFAAVSEAYSGAYKAGVGATRVLVPNKLQKTLGGVFPEAEFAPSTPSGSFARTALAQLIDASTWADGVLLAGDFGRNSETAILLESFVSKYSGLLAVGGDSLDYFFNGSEQLINREKTVLIANFAQLQKLVAKRILIKHSMDLSQLVLALSGLTKDFLGAIVTHHANQIIVAYGGKVSTIPATVADAAKMAAYASVWSLQQPPAQTFEALTCAAYELVKI